jgi:DNA-binding NarL/FixJ family response regulator
MRRILMVEDDRNFRQTLRKLLTSRFPDISLEEAGDGEEALEKIKGFLPDVIFMDIKLPGENGLSLTKKIKDAHPEITVVILTGHDLPEYKEAAFESGANHFASKHASSAKDILGLVESILSGGEPGNLR